MIEETDVQGVAILSPRSNDYEQSGQPEKYSHSINYKIQYELLALNKIHKNTGELSKQNSSLFHSWHCLFSLF